MAEAPSGRLLLLKDNQARTYLCFDFGLKQIGVASAQTVTCQASPLCILKAKEGVPDWQAVQKLVKDWQPDQLLVGQPLNMDGSASDMSARAQKFARRLEGRFGVPVIMADERLSSFEARQRIAERTREVKQLSSSAPAKDKIDAEAAALILQSWLDSH